MHSALEQKLFIFVFLVITAKFRKFREFREFRENASFAFIGAHCGRVNFISEVTLRLSFNWRQGFTAAARVLRILSSLEVLEEVITQGTNSEEAWRHLMKNSSRILWLKNSSRFFSIFHVADLRMAFCDKVFQDVSSHALRASHSGGSPWVEQIRHAVFLYIHAV